MEYPKPREYTNCDIRDYDDPEAFEHCLIDGNSNHQEKETLDGRNFSDSITYSLALAAQKVPKPYSQGYTNGVMT